MGIQITYQVASPAVTDCPAFFEHRQRWELAPEYDSKGKNSGYWPNFPFLCLLPCKDTQNWSSHPSCRQISLQSYPPSLLSLDLSAIPHRTELEDLHLILLQFIPVTHAITCCPCSRWALVTAGLHPWWPTHFSPSVPGNQEEEPSSLTAYFLSLHYQGEKFWSRCLLLILIMAWLLNPFFCCISFFVLTFESNSYPFLTIFFPLLSLALALLPALTEPSVLEHSPASWCSEGEGETDKVRKARRSWSGLLRWGAIQQRPASHLPRVAGQVADLSPIIAARKIQEGVAGKAKNKSKEVGVERDTSESFHGSVSCLSY